MRYKTQAMFNIHVKIHSSVFIQTNSKMAVQKERMDTWMAEFLYKSQDIIIAGCKFSVKQKVLFIYKTNQDKFI